MMETRSSLFPSYTAGDQMRLHGVKTDTLKLGDSLTEIALENLKRQNLELDDNDILVFTSKIVSHAKNRVVKLSDIKPSRKAKKLAKQFCLQPEFAELVIREADEILGGVEKAVLTLKDEMLMPNAGIDNKNSPVGYATLLPEDAKGIARKLRAEIKRKTGKQIGVLIVDSDLKPCRIGTTGLALAVAGFKPIKDHRGENDLYGRTIVITRHAVADDLASASHLLMGEATEKTPIVLIKGAPVDFDDNAYDGIDMKISNDKCIFMKAFLDARD